MITQKQAIELALEHYLQCKCLDEEAELGSNAKAAVDMVRDEIAEVVPLRVLQRVTHRRLVGK